MSIFRRSATTAFTDRAEAGEQLAAAVSVLNLEDPIVLALPRGGVPVAVPIAAGLHAPLDVLVVRKLGVPWNPEFGFGAVGEGGIAVVDQALLERLHISQADRDRVINSEAGEVDRRLREYRGNRPALDLRGREVVVVDDGIATGSTLSAAVALLRDRGAAKVVIAAPVGAADSVTRLRKLADEVVVLSIPPDFRAVGVHYQDFAQVSDAQVQQLLAAADGASPTVVSDSFSADGANAAARAVGLAPLQDHEVSIPAAGVTLAGFLHIPSQTPTGVVVFVHGSGSSRLSPRNVTVARRLQQRGMATLLFDLLTEPEAADPTRAPVFDIGLLAQRLEAVTTWVGEQLPGVPVGYFGASTGGGAALVAAARVQPPVAAVVVRGGRPDLAGEALGHVVSPTLLLVGGHDLQVLELNRWAARQLRCQNELVVVPGAGHLFAEPGTLEQVCDFAGDWFSRWFAPSVPAP